LWLDVLRIPIPTLHLRFTNEERFGSDQGPLY
jgi:hypothetical protein